MSMRMSGGIVLVTSLVAAIAGTGCSKSPTAPTPVPTPAPSAPPVLSLTRVTIAGNAAFVAVGETSQLVATAVFSDATTMDITSFAAWYSGNLSVATISSSGLLTVVGLGGTSITMIYQTKSASVQVSATPPGTFIVSGRVREPGNSGIGGVRVAEAELGKSTMTETFGAFSMGGLTNLRRRMTFEKEGFEPAQLDVTPTAEIDVPLQRIIRLAAGETVKPRDLAPNDMSYDVGGARCFPCRLIRIVAPTAGTLHLQLTWTESRSTLNLWADRMFVGTYPAGVVADVSVGAGETVLYVGMLSSGRHETYVPFTLATALSP